MKVNFARRRAFALSLLPLAGCEALSRLARPIRRMSTEAQFGSNFSVRATPDRKLFVIDEILDDEDLRSLERHGRSAPAAERPGPLRYVVIPPWTIRQVTRDEPLSETIHELPLDPHKRVGFAHQRDNRQNILQGKVDVENKSFDTGKLWTVDAQLNADRTRVYLTTAVHPSSWLGRSYPNEYFLDIFDMASGSRNGSSLHLGWENVRSTPKVRTFDSERILFVTGWPRPDVAIYLPHEWPSGK